ncbi:MAG TPA: 6-bladed beta-propeller, partial [Longimicrobiales bacterium]|nr:6-bladed beta-propeller [Longimicrobiales bacterium]
MLLLAPSLLLAQDTVAFPAADRPLDLRLEPLYQVGALDGEPWEEFQSLDGAAFGPDGRLYLRDERGTRVVAVGPDGGFLHRVGAPGDGPGEYRSPSGVVTLRDGRVVVWDSRKRAFLLYGADGAHLDEVRPDLQAAVPGAPFAVAPDGSVLALAERLLTGRLGHAYFTAAGVRSADGAL